MVIIWSVSVYRREKGMIWVLIYLLIGVAFDILLWYIISDADSSVKAGLIDEIWTVVLWPVWILVMIFLLKQQGD